MTHHPPRTTDDLVVGETYDLDELRDLAERTGVVVIGLPDNVETLDDACARAAREQGLDPVVGALRDVGIAVEVDQTGGFVMVARVQPFSGDNPHLCITTESYVVCEWCCGAGCKSCGYTGSPETPYYDVGRYANAERGLCGEVDDEWHELSVAEVVEVARRFVDEQRAAQANRLAELRRSGHPSTSERLYAVDIDCHDHPLDCETLSAAYHVGVVMLPNHELASWAWWYRVTGTADELRAFLVDEYCGDDDDVVATYLADAVEVVR